MKPQDQAANIDVEVAAAYGSLQFLLVLVAGWLQRQQAAIEYLKAENRMLRDWLGGRRIIFTDTERRQPTEKARMLGWRPNGREQTAPGRESGCRGRCSLREPTRRVARSGVEASNGMI